MYKLCFLFIGLFVALFVLIYEKPCNAEEHGKSSLSNIAIQSEEPKDILEIVEDAGFLRHVEGQDERRKIVADTVFESLTGETMEEWFGKALVEGLGDTIDKQMKIVERIGLNCKLTTNERMLLNFLMCHFMFYDDFKKNRADDPVLKQILDSPKLPKIMDSMKEAVDADNAIIYLFITSKSDEANIYREYTNLFPDVPNVFVSVVKVFSPCVNRPVCVVSFFITKVSDIGKPKISYRTFTIDDAPAQRTLTCPKTFVPTTKPTRNRNRNCR